MVRRSRVVARWSCAYGCGLASRPSPLWRASTQRSRPSRASDPLTEAELAGARNRLRAERLAQMITVDGRAEAIGHDFAAFEEPTLSEAWWRRVETASLADVRRVAAEVLRADRRAVVIGRAARAGASGAAERQ